MKQLKELLEKNPQGMTILVSIPAMGPHLIGKLHKIVADEYSEFDYFLQINEVCMINLQQIAQGQFAWIPMPQPFYQKNSLTPRFSQIIGYVIENEENDNSTKQLFHSYHETLMRNRAQNVGLKLQS